MIFDKTTILSDQQAITVTAVSTNVQDLRAVGTVFKHAAALKRDLGAPVMNIPFLIQVTEAFLAAGAATLTVDLQSDDNEAFASPATVWSSGAIGKATLIPGYMIGFNYLPRGTNERYYRLSYTVATGPMTAGKITAGVVAAVQYNPLP